MINKITDLGIRASSFGGELILNWTMPTELPENAKIYIFKRSKSDVTQEEIDEYFSKIDNLSTFDYNGLFVFDSERFLYNTLSDMVVRNGERYYYKIVIRDQSTGEYSEAVAVNEIPKPEIKLSVKDGKQIVTTAIKKILDNVYTSSNDKVQLGRDIQIVPQFTPTPIADNYFMIERINGSTQYRFWADQYAKTTAKQIEGVLDVDVIRATFLTTTLSTRRDLVANVFRANKTLLRKICKKLGATDCEVNIEGDYYNPQIHGLNAIGFTVIFTLLMEVKQSIPNEQTEIILGEIQHEAQG